MTRVSNYAQHLLNQSYMRGTQNRVNDAMVQVASGKIAQSYDKLGIQSFQLLGLETSQTRSNQFIANIDRALGRMDAMETTMTTLVDRATYLLTQLSSAISGSNADDIALDSLGAGFLEEVAGLLNTQHQGRHIFAGSRGDRPPVDVSAYDPTAGLPGTFTPDTSYYQGDNVEAVVRADDDFELTYGVTADDPAFENLIRALSYVEWAGDPAVATADQKAVLSEAYDLTKQAIEGLSELRSELGARYSVLESAKTGHEDFLAYAGNAISDIEDADVAEAITRVTNENVQLQASYMTLSKLSEVSLLNFLR
ncbi:MAG TPA: flagellin [Alphaproteobacteria bacterium]|nr:flagellin [Alphaproteobacteria bacterium]